MVCEQVSLGDFSGNQWITCFQETAEALLGMSAQEVGDLFHDDKQFQEVFNKAAFKTCILRLRAKMENYNVSMGGSCFSYTLRQWVHYLIPDIVILHLVVCSKSCVFWESINPYPTAFPYGNGMVLHFYQQQESSTTKTIHKVINKGLKTYV